MMDIGEFELLAKFRERLSAQGTRVHTASGDDAAITVPGGATATSVDAVVDGIHFSRDWASPSEIGHKAIAAALSDLAAMGAEPGEAYLALGVPDDIGETECLDLVDGAAAVAARFGVSIVGGDLTASPVLSVSVTVVGHAAKPEFLIRRDGAEAGDVLVLTGELGGASAGLAICQDPSAGEGLPVDLRDSLRLRQLRPAPRLDAGIALARTGATAMIDISDGLGGDAGHVAEQSGCSLEIDLDRVPVADGVTEVAGNLGLPAFALVGGGEDYELLAAVPPDRVDGALAAIAKVEMEATVVGRVLAGAGVALRLPDGRKINAKGFDQLRRSPRRNWTGDDGSHDDATWRQRRGVPRADSRPRRPAP